ncbi:polyketide synthase dehydratase domain-containing protein, partial [Microbispora tritici]|uniref:polyketide synthase dehydratase domain-containing protein n=1 Tax=Microbispora tritici TaxID=2604471 RepID=UPI0037CC1674
MSSWYPELAGRGYGYGPAFRGLRKVWRGSGEVFAEVALPEGVQAGGFAVHPALLDAVLQATDVATDPASDAASGNADAGAVRLPFAFGGVSVFAAGASLVRVRITPVADVAGDAVALEIADAFGAPVASVESYVCRAMSAQSVGERVYRIDWVPAPVTASVTAPAQSAAGKQEFTRLDVTGAAEDAGAEGLSGVPSAGVLSGMRSVVAGVLERVQEWVTVPEPGGPLVVVTRGAVGLPGEDVDVSVAPVWGLVRSAMAEWPGRFVLADIDGT